MRLDDEFFRPTGLRYAVVDLSAFLRVPTALGVVLDESGGPAFAAGAASSVTMDVAVRKALREAFQTRAFARQLRADMPDWSCDDPRKVEGFEDHVLYHAYPARPGLDDFSSPRRERVRVADVPPVEGRNVTENIRAIVARLASVGVDTYVVDTAPEDLRAAGLHAVTVVCPQLCRLDVPYEPPLLRRRAPLRRRLRDRSRRPPVHARRPQPRTAPFPVRQRDDQQLFVDAQRVVGGLR